MLFNSLVFLFYFLPLLLVVYYGVPRKFRNGVLLAFSLVFYAWGGVTYSLILIGSIGFNYLFVKQIEKKNNHQRLWLRIGITFNILLIGIFKYLDFFIENIRGLESLLFHVDQDYELLGIVLPVGISFFTFQQMSMLWDVYRNAKFKKVKLVETALYISLFPQLIAGPIIRYNDVISEINKRKENILLFRSGVERFIVGLFKKVILANTCAVVADSIMDTNLNHVDLPIAWLGIIAYSLQIYYDFSGYSDMAIGLGRMFGFKFLENFNLPYISKSIKEFWRRWHISLSSWFKDYVYIPLGGSKKSDKRTYVNLLIVFFLTGFWHGATWSFIFWGMFHGFFIVIERLGFDKVLKKMPNVLSWFYAIVVVMVGWVFFRIEEIPDAFSYVGKLFGYANESQNSLINYINKETFLVLLIAVIAASPLLKMVKNELDKSKLSNNIAIVLAKDILLLAMFLYCVIFINSGSYSPFIYFRF